MNEERASSPSEATKNDPSEQAIVHFFEQAAAVEPSAIPSVGQLRWRAQILERMAAEEQRAEVARRPALAGLALAAVAAVLAILLALSGSEPSAAAAVGTYLAASPWRPVALFLGGLLLVAVLTILPRPKSAKR